MTAEILAAAAIAVLSPTKHAADVRQATPLVLAELATQSEAYVDPLLVMAIGIEESGFNRHATSKRDARGWFGILPDGSAARGYASWGLVRPRVNVHLAVRHMARLSLMCGGEPERWVAVYDGAKKCGRPTVYTRRVMRTYAKLQAAVAKIAEGNQRAGVPAVATCGWR